MNKKYLLCSVLIIVATLAATLYAYPHLPERMPVHWDAHGDIDGYGPRAAIFIHTGVTLLLTALWLVLPRLSPQRFKVDQFQDTYWYSLMIVVALVSYLQMVSLWGAYTRTAEMGRPIIAGLAAFAALLGNVIGKVRRNFWLGIRTPWTLANERVWYSTHRLAAKSMVVGGLLSLAAIIVGLPAVLAFGLLIAGFLVPVPWSLIYYKRLERSGRLEA
jgi:uncharacterized membrane protein